MVLRHVSLSVNEYISEENHDGCEQWCRSKCFGLQFCSQKLPQLSRESHGGVKYLGPGENITPTLPNLGRCQCSLKVSHLLGKANDNNVPVRKPFSSMCSLMDSGHGLYFIHGAGCYAIHTQTREDIKIHRRGEKLDSDEEVVLFHRQVTP